MKRKSTFIENGIWLKGNTHCHTTLSDGKWDPERTAKLYRDNGYAFLFISDHRVYGSYSDFEDDNFIIFPALECDVFVKNEVFKCFHVVGGYDPASGKEPYSNSNIRMPEWKGLSSVQEIVDDLNNHGNIPILAHPVWSRNSIEDIKSLKGLVGMEIFNNVCETEFNNGDSTLLWDLLLKDGMKLWGFASDDTHDPDIHALGAWIKVKADELSKISIMKAIKAGSFYSSTGPEIFEFYVEEKVAYAQCSDASSIHFMTYDNLGKSCRAPAGGFLNEAEHTLTGQEKFVRLEVHDAYGKKAWSNPVWL